MTVQQCQWFHRMRPSSGMGTFKAEGMTGSSRWSLDDEVLVRR